MNLLAPAPTLLQALKLAARVGPRVLLTASEGQLSLRVQGDAGRAIVAVSATVTEPGGCQVDLKRLTAVIEASDADPVPLELCGTSLACRAPGFSARLATEESHEFELIAPAMYPLNVSALEPVLPAVDRIHGLRLEATGGALHAVAHNTIRFAHVATEYEGLWNATVPPPGIAALRAVADYAKDELVVGAARRGLYASGAGALFEIRIHEHDINWRPVFEPKGEQLFECDAAELRDACERLGAAAKIRMRGELVEDEKEIHAYLISHLGWLVLGATDAMGRAHKVATAIKATGFNHYVLRLRHLRAAIEANGRAVVRLLSFDGQPNSLRVECGAMESVFTLVDPAQLGKAVA